ncbi:hypothetical protein NDU88_000938 [Pleurodeles waltl]|uniref:Reverse transcriptase domain-containing protein n=1 Tax=Pleurodeles waltl TaxID=8319 RepID=A0AAV7Q1Q5_PLEWA|nr:hypothetical protein NDU88_000938 [Pleurodeles waltl]
MKHSGHQAPSRTSGEPHPIRHPRLTYDTTTLTALNPGRTPGCYRATPKRTHGSFTCRNCRFTCLRTHISPDKNVSPGNNLDCILINTRSVHRHAIELWNLIDSTTPDIAFLTETWMNPSSTPDIAIAIPDGYKIIRKDRTNCIGGGIAIAHKSSIRISTHVDDSLPDAEHLHFAIHSDPKTTLRGTLMYRPPGPRTKFSEDIADFVSPHALPSTDYILLGDLNFHLENHTDNNTTALLDNLANQGLKQLVNTPTHHAGHTLDPIFASSKHISFSHTTELAWSDHSRVHFSFKKTTVHHHTQQPPRRQWNRITTEQLTSTLSQNQPTSTTDPNEAANNLTSWISDCANLLAPLKTQANTNNHKKNSWFTPDLKDSKKECRTLGNTWRFNQTEENMSALKNATRQHHQRLRAARKSAFQNRLDNNAHNSKELFGIVKELSNPDAENNSIPPSQDLCDSLAAFFHHKITDIYNSFTTTNTNPPLEPATDNTTILTWNPTTTEETTRIMNSIHSGSPSDPCPHHIFNKADNIIAPHLRDIINASFTTATFPENWKHAELNALLKKPTADPTELKNFRPISLLPFPTKVIEKIVNAQLTTALETNDSLDPSQFGFRANHSTETALIAATNDIRSLTDKGETVALILLDLSAAFNTVCHRTLIRRLSNAGIRGKALEWIISFLSGRTQRVRLPPFRSTATEIICGVPQGSSLSPTLFNIYMTPWRTSHENTDSTSYTTPTTPSSSYPSPTTPPQQEPDYTKA